MFLEDSAKNQFMFGDMNFFELCKMVLDQMLTIVVAKLKMIKLKNQLLEMADLSSKNTQSTKFEKKILNLKEVVTYSTFLCSGTQALERKNEQTHII